MEKLTYEKLQQLLDFKDDYCISLYMMTHPTGREQQQDPIRFKNLLTRAKDRLERSGLGKTDIKERLAPAEKLISDQHFWQHQENGLALFIGSDFFYMNRFPDQFPEILIISNKFHLKPLIPFIDQQNKFYILTLSQNEIRFLMANQNEISEVGLEEIPTSLSEALRFDVHEKQLQYHSSTTSPGSANVRTSIYHGHGAGEDDEKSEILRFFNQVDAGILEFLNGKTAPLMVVGVDYLLPIYQEANSYPHLVTEKGIGNPENLSLQKLHQKTKKAMAPYFDQDRKNAIKKYEQLNGSNSEMASHQLDEIIQASHDGQIESLFVELDTQVWGYYNAEKRTFEQHDEFKAGDRDLLDVCAFQTLKHGGKVYALNSEDMPDQWIAALYRYKY